LQKDRKVTKLMTKWKSKKSMRSHNITTLFLTFEPGGAPSPRVRCLLGRYLLTYILVLTYLRSF
jgi:hypothetical protein